MGYKFRWYTIVVELYTSSYIPVVWDTSLDETRFQHILIQDQVAYDNKLKCYIDGVHTKTLSIPSERLFINDTNFGY